ncbi:hypothetical protein SMACR_00393 [Sordaria macrospora]|uniref:WGS project CABT00000000 data, contig 2.1 n=2 Tax=Sordaria macrospora TaxID=5147 RepID=F7VKZ8_SORMK|nr:uncharacterized protein SMAC_00393 [Sordaria macrospora k-hell]KAA8630806.1 hypothetical protein SMACR_00393 [Sordaria macrospora]KAH7627660.1 hypothetical protein B0T09DRAFT_188240 [Sordaria sp. MPI-SDFR-AT-0083]WPJ59137.1 hypothetical protein SMAC4_00393 [Sordaria macrospora]CCC06175.1 unnamed protein product [Sordaria macrospora k-hell]
MASMFKALQPYPEDRLHLRLHRARSVILTSQELVEIRAAQRTFEGAYMRTALSQFSFALIILKIFTSEFYPIGALFAVYGAAVMLVAIYRRYEGNRQFFDQEVEEDLDDDERDGEDGEDGVGSASASGTAYQGGGLGRSRRTGGIGEVVGVDGMGESGGGMQGQRLERRKTVVVVKKKFRTSANSVALLTGLSFAAYVALMVLLWHLSK